MGDIKVTFWGICTVIGSRIALADASQAVIDGIQRLKEMGIEPHVAQLHLQCADIVRIGAMPVVEAPEGHLRLDLDHVALRIANGGADLLDTSGIACLPVLKLIAVPPPGPPVDAAVVGGPAMSAVFELTTGTLQSYVLDPNKPSAAVSVLTATTLGPPMLTVTPFGPSGANLSIELRSGASVVITNLPAPDSGSVDQETDFWLHYLTAPGALPHYVNVPEEIQCPPSPTPLDDGGLGLFVGPGCSNSNYP